MGSPVSLSRMHWAHEPGIDGGRFMEWVARSPSPRPSPLGEGEPPARVAIGPGVERALGCAATG
ncbi:hypothetical protein SBV1_60037 [Verrucomicrobia bacterium]|nr:hypothetical protein SBV1_60037 [Verrucomicrobiota bacterium]